jgi:hypothetical protein
MHWLAGRLAADAVGVHLQQDGEAVTGAELADVISATDPGAMSQRMPVCLERTASACRSRHVAGGQGTGRQRRSARMDEVKAGRMSIEQATRAVHHSFLRLLGEADSAQG